MSPLLLWCLAAIGPLLWSALVYKVMSRFWPPQPHAPVPLAGKPAISHSIDFQI